MAATVIKQAKLVAAAGLVCLLATACAHDEPDRDLQRLPQYQAGWNDGCRTAHNRERGFATKVFRNEDLFGQDSAYRAGWRAGSQNCGTSDGLGRNPMFEDQQIGPAPLL